MGGNGVGRAVTDTPPVFEGEVPSDRMSNASDYSFQSGEFIDSQDIFERQNEFSDASFKVHAKTKIPKSDSVNIFNVNEDPFDDEFFK